MIKYNSELAPNFDIQLSKSKSYEYYNFINLKFILITQYD